MLPFLQLAKGGWRRYLALGLWWRSWVIIPVFTLVEYPVGVIRTTFTLREWWHVLWLALFATGLLLILIHGLRIVIGTAWKVLDRIRRGVRVNLRREREPLPAMEDYRWLTNRNHGIVTCLLAIHRRASRTKVSHSWFGPIQHCPNHSNGSLESHFVSRDFRRSLPGLDARYSVERHAQRR